MVKKIIETRQFSKSLDAFFKKRQLVRQDYDAFKNEVVTNPEIGDIIVGTGGVRKIRLKSATRGKSGGFRICYYYLVKDEEVYFLLIYGKNEQENLSMEEKKALKLTVSFLKENNE